MENNQMNCSAESCGTPRKRPMVSVGMLAYNHEKYISRALDSILMQEVSFDYEIVIADDCSTDGTRDIIWEYQKRYPNVIRPIFNEINLGGQNSANVIRTACVGKYRATLEGDDYWVSTTKLQKQVNFLEENPDYIAIGGDFVCIDDSGKPCKFPWGDIRYTYCQGEEYTMEDLQNWLLPAHASCMCFRNIFVEISQEELDYFHSIKVLGDRRTSMYLLMHGRIKHQKEVLMVRRVLTQSSSSMTTLTKQTNWHARNYMWLIETERCVREHFHRDLDLSKHKELRWSSSINVFVYNPSISNLKLMWFIYKHSDNKFQYRKILRLKLSEGIDKSIQKQGRAKTYKMLVQKLFSCVKRVFLGTSKSKKQENELYERSLGTQFI